MATQLGLTVDLQMEATYAVNFLDLVIRVIHKSKSVRDANPQKIKGYARCRTQQGLLSLIVSDSSLP